MTLAVRLNERSCKVCECTFMQVRTMQIVCSPRCARQAPKIAKQDQMNDLKLRKDALKTKTQLVKAAQIALNGFVRARDQGRPCISCGRPHNATPNTWDAGHFRSVGSAVHMRFVEDNVHGQCKHCNLHLAGNVVAYRAGLIERIGLHSVEAIERDQCLRKYTREGLIALADHYKTEAKKLKRQCSHD